MSAAMPIIASNVGGVPDMLENERSALLIEPNADEIVEVILKLKENESLRRSLGQEAYRDNLKQYIWVKSIVMFLKTIL